MAELTPLQKAQKILATKATIKSALTSKGQTPTDVLDTYDDNILAIKTISSDGTFIDGDSNLELDKSAITSITNNTENTSLDILIDDAGDTLLAEGAGIEASVGYDKVKTAAGITADKILAGQSILDVTGTATADATAVAEDIVNGKTAYVNGQKITGSIETLEAPFEHDWQASTITYYDDDKKGQYISLKTPSPENIYIKTGAGINAEISAADVTTAIGLTPAKIVSGNTILGVAGTAIELQGETKIVDPAITQQVLTPSTGKNGFTQVTVNAVTSDIDANIVTGNIKSGVTILGVSGKSSVVDTDDATATAADIDTGKTAYVNGTRLVGTSTAKADKEALEEQIEDLRQELADITDADDRTATMQTIINNLETEMTQLKTDKATLQAQVTQLQTDLDDLEAVLDDILGE